MAKEIREIDYEDLEQYQKVLKEVFDTDLPLSKVRENFDLAMESEGTKIYGYFLDGVLAGTVLINIIYKVSGKEATIWSVGVLEEYRRQGIAIELMKYAEKEIRKIGVNKIWLFSGIQRDKAHELYRKLEYDDNGYLAFVKDSRKK